MKKSSAETFNDKLFKKGWGVSSVFYTFSVYGRMQSKTSRNFWVY